MDSYEDLGTSWIPVEMVLALSQTIASFGLKQTSVCHRKGPTWTLPAFGLILRDIMLALESL